MGNKDITILGKDIIVKSNLTQVTSEQIQKGRCKAYKYIL